MKQFFKSFLNLGAFLLIGMFLLVIGIFIYMEYALPDVNALKIVQLQTPMRIFTHDGKLISEFGAKRRLPITLDQVPKPLIQAILATEDQRFYEHEGVDPIGLMRAAVQLLLHGKKTQGGSTITMQVARNFFLTRKKTFSRKFKEILLAIKIDRELGKDKILELYLNKIYLGNRAYGIGAAAHVYYGKKLHELTLPEMAMLAGLPKAPSANNPLANPKRALERRNHVLERMMQAGYIDKKTYDKAIKAPLTAKYHGLKVQVDAPYVAEEVRRELVEMFGKSVYAQGLQVYTTTDARLQKAANQSVHRALLAYDRRHGYRGPITNLGQPDPDTLEQWQEALAKLPAINGLHSAVIVGVTDQTARAMLASGKVVTIPWSGLRWARPALNDDRLGPQPTQANDVVLMGDVIRISEQSHGQWRLGQVPLIEGALVALNSDNGAIRAMVGGFHYRQSHFNRATQAKRQAGSNFKPFLYSAALAQGMTLATIINDAPVVLNDPSQETLWRPQNDTREFYGPTRLRVGLIKSRNLVSIRLLERMGIPYARQYIARFGFSREQMPDGLSLSLGSGTVTPVQLAASYATFSNGGYAVKPFLLERITSSTGKLIYQSKNKSLDPEQRELSRVLTPQIAYLITSALQDVIRRGTGRRALVLKRRDLSGKTGTTNQQNDAWFSGYNRDLVVTTWVGFDQPKSLHEYAARAALPMWIDFMRIALKGKPEHAMAMPSGLVTVRIDPKTGLPTQQGSHRTIFETFRQEYLPKNVKSNPEQNHQGERTSHSEEQLF